MGRILLLFTIFLYSAALPAADFRVVDLHYKERHFKNYGQIKDLRGEYEKMISASTLTKQELLYAVSQVAKLDLILADYLPDLISVSKEDRKEASEHCLSAVKKIEEISQEHYVMFSMRCLFTRYRRAPMLEIIDLNGRILEILVKHNRFAVSGVDGGDYYRALGQLRMYRRFIGHGSFFDIQEAGVNVYKPAQIRSAPLVPLSQKYSGNDYYETHFLVGKYLVNKGILDNRKDLIHDALRLWRQYIEEMDFLEEIADDRKFNERLLENRAIKARMLLYEKIIAPCIKKSDWYSCIYDSELKHE